MKRGKVIEVGVVGTKLIFGCAEIGKTITLDVMELTKEIQDYALIHGIKQKVVDAAAIERDPETGKPATAEVKFYAIQSMVERLKRGEWNSRESGGAIFPILLKLFPNRDEGELREWWNGKSVAEQRAIRNSKRVQDLMPKGSGKGDELLGELG